MNKQAVFTFLLGIIGILSMSSAVVAFSYITSVGPITKSSWRLQITTLCFAGCLALPIKRKSIKETIKKYYLHIIFSGLSIGGHFVLWNISMEYTSVAHSLVFLYSCPILLVLFYLTIKKSPSKLQISGSLIGFSGLSLMCFMSNSSEGTTWYGDLISLLGALVLCINLVLSEKPMAEFPLCYLFLIHLISAIFCTVLSVSLESQDRTSLISFLYEFQGIYAVYLGVVCGFIGNGAFYMLLKRVDPFVVSVIINFDPVVGSFFAWLFGFLTTPGTFTFVGGGLVVVGNLIATKGKKVKKSTVCGIRELDSGCSQGASRDEMECNQEGEENYEKTAQVLPSCIGELDLGPGGESELSCSIPVRTGIAEVVSESSQVN